MLTVVPILDFVSVDMPFAMDALIVLTERMNPTMNVGQGSLRLREVKPSLGKSILGIGSLKRRNSQLSRERSLSLPGSEEISTSC